MILKPLDLDNTIKNWKTDLFNRKTYTYHEVFPSTMHKIISLPTLEGDIKEGLKNRLNKKPDVPIHSMGYFKINNGSLVGKGLVIDRKTQLLYSKTLTFDKYINKRVKSFCSKIKFSESSTTLDANLKTVKVSEPVINVMMPGMYIYGHWLIDILPKLYLLQQTKKFNECKIVLPNDIPGFWKSFFKLLHIPESQVLFFDPTKEILKCKSIYLPTKARVIDGSWIAPYVGTIYDQLVTQNTQSIEQQDGFDKLYLSRRKLKKQFRKLVNRDEISKTIMAAGFKEIFPEDYSIEEQIKIFSKAKVLIGEFGSALHNSLFGTNDLQVISMQSNHIPLLVQWGICNVKKQKCHLIFGNAIETRASINSDFVIDSDILKSTLAKVS